MYCSQCENTTDEIECISSHQEKSKKQEVESSKDSSSSKDATHCLKEELAAFHTKGWAVISILLSVWVVIAIGLFIYSSDMPVVKKNDIKNPPFDETLKIGQIRHQSQSKLERS